MKLWIADDIANAERLRSLGVEVGWYHEASGEWRNCEVSDEALTKLEPLWGELLWGPEAA